MDKLGRPKVGGMWAPGVKPLLEGTKVLLTGILTHDPEISTCGRTIRAMTSIVDHPRRAEEGLLSAVAAAKYLGLSTAYFHERIKQQLPQVRITDTCVRYRIVDLDEWASERTVSPTS